MVLGLAACFRREEVTRVSKGWLLYVKAELVGGGGWLV